MRFLRRLLLSLLVLVLALLVAAWSSADRVFKRELEKRLAQIFATEVRLDEVDVSLLSGEVDLEGFAVANPEMFGDRPMLSAERFEAKVGLASVFSSPLVVEKVILHSPTIRVTMLEDGRVNLNQALKPQERPDEGAEQEPFAVSVERLEVVALVLEYEDRGSDREPVKASLERLDLRLFQLLLGSTGDRPVADLRVTGEVVSGDARAPLMLSAFAPPPGREGLRDFHVDLYAAGIDLAPFEAYLTPAATTVLGGRYLDVDLRCEAVAGALEGVLGLRSSGGENYRLPLRGEIGAPRLADDAGVLAAFSLPRQKLGRVFGAIAGGGRDLEALARKEPGRIIDGARRTAEGAGREGVEIAGEVGQVGAELVEQVGETGEDLVEGVKDVAVDPTRAPEKVVDAAKGVGRRGAKLVKGVLGTGRKVAEEVVDTAESGAEEVVGRAGNLAKRVLTLPELLAGSEAGVDRARRLGAERARYEEAARRMLQLRLDEARKIGDEETARRAQGELDALP